ncbi:cytochrome P450 [Halalkalibacillus sediminis]|uniref:cytochrome P450 n=1 Tax=Halalkalibacillus sediminis TaxID=2018042 RepID=UPI0026B77D1B
MNVYDEAKMVLSRVAVKWTGVPIKEDEIEQWTEELSDLFEKASSVGPKHWKARRSRSKAEDWIEGLVEKVRAGTVDVPKDRALYQFAWHRDLNGDLLDKHVVAVELLNLLRPIVAVSVYIDFTVLALQQFPEEKEKLRSSDENKLQNFIQEVRRYYPFFPSTAARVKKDFTWNGYEFKENTLTLLDLYGTNHDPAIWESPDQFVPERFAEWNGNPFNFIPQGGGEFGVGHRCAGEWITIEILKETVHIFVNKITFEFPDQNISYSMNDIPSLPESKVVLKSVRLIR